MNVEKLLTTKECLNAVLVGEAIVVVNFAFLLSYNPCQLGTWKVLGRFLREGATQQSTKNSVT